MRKTFLTFVLSTALLLAVPLTISATETNEEKAIGSANKAVDTYDVIIKYDSTKDTFINRHRFEKRKGTFQIQILPALDTSHTYDLIVSQSAEGADSINRHTTKAIDRVYVPSEWRKDSLLLKAENMCNILNEKCTLQVYPMGSFKTLKFPILIQTTELKTIIIGERISSAEIRITQKSFQETNPDYLISFLLYLLIAIPTLGITYIFLTTNKIKNKTSS